MIMENTCTNTCAYYETFKMDREGKKRCPHFVETKWMNEERDQPFYLEDCAPKRSLFLQIEAFNRMRGVQKSFEEERNYQHKNLQLIMAMAGKMSETPQLPFDDAEVLEIEDNTK